MMNMGICRLWEIGQSNIMLIGYGYLPIIKMRNVYLALQLVLALSFPI